MMRSQKRSGTGIVKRLTTGFLSLALTASLLPAVSISAAAEDSWLQPYLDKLVSWGVMRGDQAGNLDPDRPITRAEYSSLINRAYGYDDTEKNPFSDVSTSDWYYDDIIVGSAAGYFSGTSATTAAPLSTLTREQAAVILARNLMLQESLGETLNFSDSRSLSDWSRGLVKSAAQQGVVKGYPDGTFQPQRDITRGEVAVLLVNAIGTPISQPGEYTLGSTYGNVTISSSGVTLRNTVIAGDLYITGGVGLGYVTLENVTVLGKIIASGAGESNKGDSSIILRNVTAPQMVVDSPANQFVTVRAEGDTKIDSTSVRTPSYLEDATAEDEGFTYIELRGEDGTTLELAGNIKEVINLTPSSVLTVAKGSAQTVTMDESALGASVTVGAGAEIKTLNLDASTKVTGGGDVENLNVNAAGSSTSMLPDTITIRPGLTANIAGETMDSVTAAESSEAPRILSGYPKVSDLAPTTANVLFRTNKRGTLYWAVSSITDGSVGEEDLISPPSYATKILKSGSMAAAASNTDYTAKVSGLTSDGSYYLSAVLVDARNQRSPVKVTAFTTPDNTVPNFATGYPEMTKITNTTAQVAVMPTKSCKLYYALLPKGSTAPAGADFKASAVSGNLGFGSMDVVKNTVSLFYVNNKALEELATYDLYLWLTDADGAKSSAVKKLTFTTVDKTPPQFLTAPTVNVIKETSVGLVASLNETGTVYWVVVKEGETYPKPLAGSTDTTVPLTSTTAKLQVASGMNALKSGKVNATPNKDLSISVSGLSAETAYDLYYVAQDKAGNYSDSVEKLTIHTLDTNPPSITQKFTRTSDSAGTVPMADTDIQIVFSESIQDTNGELFLELYQTAQDNTKTAQQRAAALDQLTELVAQDIQLWDATDLPATQAEVREDAADDSWTVDYSKVIVSMDDGKTVFTFKSGTDQALNLRSGSSYYFQISNIADTSSNKNYIRPNPQQLTTFKTAFAQINLKRTSESSLPVPSNDPASPSTDPVTVDMSFQMLPISTAKVDNSVSWDMLIWSDSMISFKLYRREKATSSTTFGTWTYLGSADAASTDGTYTGVSLSRAVIGQGGAQTPVYEPLNSLDEDTVYEYALSVVSLNGETDRTAWSQEVNVQISLAAGGKNDLDNLASNVSPVSWTNAISDWGITSVGQPDPFTIVKKFSDSQAPKFTGVFPEFTPGDSSVKMSLMLDRAGTVYYAVAPVSYTANPKSITYSLNTKDSEGNDVYPEAVPVSGQDTTSVPTLALPLYTTIVKPNFATSLIQSGNKSYGGSGSLLDITVTDLEPETLYYAYFVLKGSSTSSPFSQVFCYQFTTEEVTRPVITLDINNPTVNVTVDSDATVDYLLALNDKEGAAFQELMKDNAISGFTTSIDYKAGMTVLDAMSTDVRDEATGKSAGSLFDKYAKTEARDRFANLIRNQSVNSSNIVMKGQKTFLASNPMTSVDCKGYMLAGSWYTFLAVGKSTLDSGDAFRAIRPVFLQDSTPPLVTTCSLALTKTPTSTTCSGTLTLVFNETLYFKERDSSTTTQKIYAVQAISELNPPAGFVSILPTVIPTIPTINNTIDLIAGKEGVKISTLQFNLTDAAPGSVISFDANLCDESGNSRDSTPLTLVLQIEAQTDASGNVTYRPYFTITKQWDGTSSQ